MAALDEILVAFAQFDVDGNGTIDADELRRVLVKLDPDVFNADAVQELFIAADVNKDGKLDLREFMNWLLIDPNAKEALKALDRNRMQKMGMILISKDIPWMKEPVDSRAFNKAAITLIHPAYKEAAYANVLDNDFFNLEDQNAGTIFDVGEEADTLAAAHALISVEKHLVPEQAFIQPAQKRIGHETHEVPLTDAKAAPLVYAALVAGCKHVKVLGASWGERLTTAVIEGLQDAQIEGMWLCNAYINEENDIVDIVESIPDDSSLATLDVSGNVVGLDGLRAIHAALVRCPNFRSIYLYDIGPWVDGDGLGCRSNNEEELALLQELRNIVRDKGGVLQNEAFHEGDISMDEDVKLTDARLDKSVVPGRAARVKNNTIQGGRTMLRSRPFDGGGKFCKGWVSDGQSVLIVQVSAKRDWVYVRKQAADPVKGWLKACSVQAS